MANAINSEGKKIKIAILRHRDGKISVADDVHGISLLHLVAVWHTNKIRVLQYLRNKSGESNTLRFRGIKLVSVNFLA